MKDLFLKSWQTTLVGLLIIAFAIYQIFVAKVAVDLQAIVSLLFGVGFLVAKDGSASHSKDK